MRALLILDMLNTFEFPEGKDLLPKAKACAKNIFKLKKRCILNNIPTIYVNDNFGKWRSNWKDIYELCSTKNAIGKDIALLLEPNEKDYFVLKPKHSAFYLTPLEILLQELKVKELIITGIAGNICVLFTANDAHMRDYKVIIPSDCIASNNEKYNNFALHQFKNVFKFRTTASQNLKLLRR